MVRAGCAGPVRNTYVSGIVLPQNPVRNRSARAEASRGLGSRAEREFHVRTTLLRGTDRLDR